MQSECIIIFDGKCGLCQNSVRRIIARDCNEAFLFAAAQSVAGGKLQREHSVDSIAEGTLMLLQDGVVHKRGEAVMRICAELRGLRWLATLMSFFPRFVRDGIYDIIARRRQKWTSNTVEFSDFVKEHSDRFLA